jgi:hypothetical protein
MDKKCLLVIAAMLIVPSCAQAASNFKYGQTTATPVYNQNNYINQKITGKGTLKGSVVTVPAGQKFTSVITTPLSSANLTLGQTVTAALGSDFYYGGNLIAPSGSTVSGSVIEVSKAKHGSMNGKLMVRFTQIVTPYGVQIPISAVIKTDDNTGVLVGGTKMDVAKNYGKDLAVGSAAGALSGVVIGALSGGSVGKGAALATAVGAGGGLVKSVWDKGNDVTLPANASVDLILTQPITVNPSSYNQNY